MLPSREIREEKVEESCGEVFVDDELSKLNESERAMYDGSVDECSKADYSINESLATRLDVSKSIATDEALYEDTSSESDRDVHNIDTPDEVALYHISVDGDEDLSRGDSLIASSMAPDPILNEEESSDEITDLTPEGTNKAATIQGDICFTPRSPDEANEIEVKRNICNMKEGNLSSFFTESLNEKAENVNTARNTSSSRGKSTNASTRIRSGKPDNLERRSQTVAASSVASLSSSRSIARQTQIYFEKAKLREEIERLRQQIQKLESKALTAEPAVGEKGREAFNTLKQSSDTTRSEDPINNLTLSNCVSIQNSKQEGFNVERLAQEISLACYGTASEVEMIDNCCKGLHTSRKMASEFEVIEENQGDFSNELVDAQELLSPRHSESSITLSRTEDSKASFDSARLLHSVSITDDEVPLGRNLDELTNVQDKTASVSRILNQALATNFFVKRDEKVAEKSKTKQIVDNIVDSNQEIENIPQEKLQYDNDDGPHTSRTDNVTSFAPEKEHSKFAAKNSDTGQEADANETAASTAEESDDETAFVRLLNSDPWDEGSQLDESKLLNCINCFPHYCSVKHSFEGFHGSIYPLSAICALGASLSTIKKCYQAFPDAITKADAWVGTCLHYACSYRAPFPVVEYLAKKNPLALKAVNQFSRLPLHM
jgi:hypothetical protein